MVLWDHKQIDDICTGTPVIQLYKEVLYNWLGST